MLLAYAEESYDPERYWMAALLCPGATVQPLTEALDVVCAETAVSYGTSPTAELHGHELFHARGDWERLSTMVRARISVYRRAFDAIAVSGAEILIRGVDRKGLERTCHSQSWRG